MIQHLVLIPRPPHPVLSLAVQRAGGDLKGLLMWHVPRLTSCSVCLHLSLFSPLRCSFSEFSTFFLLSLSCKSNNYCINHSCVMSDMAHIMCEILPGLLPAFRTASDKGWALRPGNKAKQEFIIAINSWCYIADYIPTLNLVPIPSNR